MDKPAGISIVADKILTPLQLVGVDDDIDNLEVLKIVRFLIALDSDSNANNGMSLDENRVLGDNLSLFEVNLEDTFGNSLIFPTLEEARVHLFQSFNRVDCLATPTPTPTKTPQPTLILMPTPTPIVTKMPQPTLIPIATPTPIATKTPLPTQIPTATPIATKTPLPTQIPTATPTPIATKIPLPTLMPTVTPTPTRSPISSSISTPIPTTPAPILVPTPPTIEGSPKTTTNIYDTYQFIPLANDINGDTLAFTIENKPSWANFNPLTGVLSGNPLVEENYENIIISVSDGSETVSLAPFSINVLPARNIAHVFGVATQSADSSYQY